MGRVISGLPIIKSIKPSILLTMKEQTQISEKRKQELVLDESHLDTFIGEISDVMSEETSKLFSKALKSFQEDLEKLGIKGYWND